MALHPSFPKSPYAVLDPDILRFPPDEELRERGYVEASENSLNQMKIAREEGNRPYVITLKLSRS